jgi:hypothetical protein
VFVFITYFLKIFLSSIYIKKSNAPIKIKELKLFLDYFIFLFFIYLDDIILSLRFFF